MKGSSNMPNNVKHRSIWAPLHLPDSLFALGSLGPDVAAFFMTAIVSGKRGVFRLLLSFVHWRAGVKWCLLMLVGVPALFFLSYLIMPGAIAGFHAPHWDFLLIYATTFIGVFSLVGMAPTTEEIGWRGFALPQLQRGVEPLRGTIIVGILWGVWHLPFFFAPLAPKFVGPDASLPTSGAN
jgi:membrane protease YdiL (CAAX protease family)